MVAFLVGHPGLRSAWIDITSERAGCDEDEELENVVANLPEHHNPWKSRILAEFQRWKQFHALLEPLRTIKSKDGIRISWEDWRCEYLETSRRNASKWAFVEQLNLDMAKASARGKTP